MSSKRTHDDLLISPKIEGNFSNQQLACFFGPLLVMVCVTACAYSRVSLAFGRLGADGSLERRKGYAELQRRVPSALLPWPPALGQRVKAKRT